MPASAFWLKTVKASLTMSMPKAWKILPALKYLLKWMVNSYEQKSKRKSFFSSKSSQNHKVDVIRSNKNKNKLLINFVMLEKSKIINFKFLCDEWSTLINWLKRGEERVRERKSEGESGRKWKNSRFFFKIMKDEKRIKK